MNVVFQPFDTWHYLMNLRQDASGALQCDKMGDDFYLVLRLPYQQDLNAIPPSAFLSVLHHTADRLLQAANQFIKVGDTVELGLFAKAAVVMGFQILGMQNCACSYAMFVCNIKMMEDTSKLMTVFAHPNGLFAAGNVCHVPAVLKLRLSQDKIVKHRKEKFTGYYVAEFSGSVELEDSRIWYNIPGSKIDYPINSAMLRQKRIYIKSELQPKFDSSGGVRIELVN